MPRRREPITSVAPARRQALEVVDRRHRRAEAARELLGDVEAVACRFAARGEGTSTSTHSIERMNQAIKAATSAAVNAVRTQPMRVIAGPPGRRGDAHDRGQHAIEVGAQAQDVLGRERPAAVDSELPGVDEGGDEIAARRRQRGAGEADAIALGARIADRDLVRVDEPRQRAAIEQRERGAAFAGEPQLAHGRADVGGQALGADVSSRTWLGRRAPRVPIESP